MERELVERAQRGDQEAFAALVHLVADRLYAVAFRILRDRDRAEDALQQALVDAWQDLPDLRDPGRFEAWAYRLVCRASCHEARRARRWTGRIREIGVADGPVGDDRWSQVSDRDELERSFRRLTPEHRAVLVLHYFVGLPVSEIAESLGLPVGTAGSRLHYAVRSLRAAYEADARNVVAWRHPA
ncbi:MAG: sigma-70 family RNA polymerase sigma factor [Chloroflexi bacterium]|nr:sigma-70 family RNA polymerase sigma factor [Chloroflexota bacterium]